MWVAIPGGSLNIDIFPDKIIVLQKGKIVESGTFEELVTVRGGYFNQLVEKQSIAKWVGANIFLYQHFYCDNFGLSIDNQLSLKEVR